MTILDDAPTPTIQRDRWGRPLITPLDGGKAIGYTRVSTAAKGLDDNQGLIDWSTCAGIVGVFKRPGLSAAWQSLVAEHGDPWYASADSKKRAKDLVKQSKEAGGSSDRAELGTALHKLTELVDLGRTLEHVQPNLASDVEAYRRTMAESGIEVLSDYLEAFVVLDDLKVAGSFDSLVRLPDGRVVVADKKTGSSLDYSWLSFATQLALYSRGVLYDPATNARTPLPDVDQTTGLIIHLPAGTGTCTLHEVDLVAGWEAAQLSMEVRKWRTRKGLGKPWSGGAGGGDGVGQFSSLHHQASTAGTTASVNLSHPTEASPVTSKTAQFAATAGCIDSQSSDRRGTAAMRQQTSTSTETTTPAATGAPECAASTATPPPTSQPSSTGETSTAATTLRDAVTDGKRSWLTERLELVKRNPKATQMLQTAWTDNQLPKWAECTDEHYDTVATMLDLVEKWHELPFTPEPVPLPDLPPEPTPKPSTVDQADMDPAEVDELLAAVKADPEVHSFIDRIIAARGPGVPAFSPRTVPCRRRYQIVRAMQAWAAVSDERGLRAGLAVVLGDDAMQNHTTGALLSALSTDEATQLAGIAEAIITDELMLDRDGDGLIVRKVA